MALQAPQFQPRSFPREVCIAWFLRTLGFWRPAIKLKPDQPIVAHSFLPCNWHRPWGSEMPLDEQRPGPEPAVAPTSVQGSGQERSQDWPETQTRAVRQMGLSASTGTLAVTGSQHLFLFAGCSGLTEAQREASLDFLLGQASREPIFNRRQSSGLSFNG